MFYQHTFHTSVHHITYSYYYIFIFGPQTFSLSSSLLYSRWCWPCSGISPLHLRWWAYLSQLLWVAASFQNVTLSRPIYLTIKMHQTITILASSSKLFPFVLSSFICGFHIFLSESQNIKHLVVNSPSIKMNHFSDPLILS